MFKFNNKHIFTGYLKQLLHDFNLPKFRVYTKEQQKYYNEHLAEKNVICTVVRSNNTFTEEPNGSGVVTAVYPKTMYYAPYIKDNKIQEYLQLKDSNGESYYVWKDLGSYVENNKVIIQGNLTNTDKQLNYRHMTDYNYNSYYLNYTKNLQIKDNIYDSYTHEYLGDYLRFMRDYNDINLMPLYNCFSNRLCDKLHLKFMVNGTSIKFDTTDTNYKYYLIPVKLFQRYTIAIDSVLPIEMCCCMYNNYQDTREKFQNSTYSLAAKTYKKVSHTLFSQPFIYDKILDLTEEATTADSPTELAQNESNLKLVLKVPANNDSTIVILEGNYLNWNDEIGYNNTKQINHTIINIDNIDSYDNTDLITPLQLLKFNIRDQIPFADRLIEYLTGNVITNATDIDDDIERAQTVMTLNQSIRQPEFIEVEGELTANAKFVADTPYDDFKFPGIWDNKMRYIAYEYIQNHKKLCNNISINHDILGYIDKDIEHNYKYTNISTNTTYGIVDVDIYDETNFMRRVVKYGK